MSDELHTTGERLHWARVNAGLGVRQLARLMDVSHPMVSYWEGGSRPLPIERARQAASICDVDVEWLTCGASTLSEEGRRILRAAKKLTPEDQCKLRELLERMPKVAS